MGKNDYTIYTALGVLLIPASVLWILYRHGFLSIIDTLAVGVLAAAALLFGVKYLITKKVFSFK